jgi:hypothetical protein
MSQEQPCGLDQAPIAALPPVFAHLDIAEHYQEGRFSSRLEAEIADILWNGQPVGDDHRQYVVYCIDAEYGPNPF